MKRWSYLMGVIVFILFVIAFFNIAYPFEIQTIEAQNGNLSLGSFDFETEGVLVLGGDWSFYHEQLVSYESMLQNEGHSSLIEVGIGWDEQTVQGDAIGAFSYGTYRLDLDFDPDKTQVITFKVGEFYTAMDMYWNGELVAKVGEVTTSRDGAEGDYIPLTVTVPVTQSHNILSVQTSNFLQNTGGAWGNVYLGTPKNIGLINQRNLIVQVFSIGALLMIGWYHVILYLIRKEGLPLLVFGSLTILLSIREMLMGERIILAVMPGLPWSIRLSFEFISYYASVGLFAFFLYLMYQEIFSKNVMKVIGITSAVFVVITVFTEPRIFTFTLVPYQIFTVMVAIYVIYIVIRGFSVFELGSDIILFGGLLVVLFAVNDIFYTLRWIQTGYLMPVSLIVLSTCQSAVLALQHTNAHKDAIKYAEKSRRANEALFQMNEELEGQVAERTRELTEKNRKLEHLANTDGLTGLYNRIAMNEFLNKAAESATRHHVPFCVAMIDIDQFKKINDTHGHYTGDEVLKKIANLMVGHIRKGDIIGRYGGEEFIGIFTGVNLGKAYELADRLRHLIATSCCNKENISVTISVGLAEFDPDDHIEELIRKADDCLYRAKYAGRNLTVAYGLDGEIHFEHESILDQLMHNEEEVCS